MIAVLALIMVLIFGFRENRRGFYGLASRLDSLERRMAVLESYMRNQPPKVNRISPRDDAEFARIAEESPPRRGGHKPS